MTELPPSTPLPAHEPPPVQDVHHFHRFPTGGTQFTRDPESRAREHEQTGEDIYRVPRSPGYRAEWFRRMPNGGTVLSKPADRPAFEVTSRVIVPEMPNGGGAVNRLPDANASAGEDVGGGENGDK